jgi:signal transduction histidine kinase
LRSPVLANVFTSCFRWEYNVNLLELNRVLVVDVRQSLYLIYKEAVTNTAKHTSGCTVNINLTDGADGFTVSIHDSY